MSETLPNDGLLKAAKLLTGFFMILLGIVFVGLTVAIPIFHLSRDHVAENMVAEATATLGGTLGVITVLLLLGMALIALAFIFLRTLKQMINSVGEGDPFIEENAERLKKMGWVAVIIELLKIPAGAIALFLAEQFKPDTFELDLEFSLTGFLVALVLFILARVFRHGARMREDLEGTV